MQGMQARGKLVEDDGRVDEELGGDRGQMLGGGKGQLGGGAHRG